VCANFPVIKYRNARDTNKTTKMEHRRVWMGGEGGFDGELTFLGVESEASEAGSSSFEYLTSAAYFTYMSMRRCNPDVSEDVRIFSTEERGSEEWKVPSFVFVAHFQLVLWNHVTTAVSPRPIIYIYICSLCFCEGWKGSGRQGLLRPAATRPHQ